MIASPQALLAAIVIGAVATSAANAPADPVEPEILVVARKAMTIRYQLRKDPRSGAIACRIKRSSGDRILDARICDAAISCAPAGEAKPDLDALRACLEPRHMQVIEARAAERVEAARRR